MVGGMSDRTDFFTGQLVTQQDMDVSFDGLEQAIWNAAADMGFFGIITGFAVTESTPNALTVQVANGSAYSGEGKRLLITELDSTVDISIDRDLNETAVLTGGAKRYVSVIVTPDRNLDDVRPDINQFPVYYRRYEIAKIEVIMGSEASSPFPPEVPVESILLCDILLSFSQATVTDADIEFDRCEYMFSFEYASVVQKYATISLALQSLADLITNNTPSWSTILASYGGSTTWANAVQWLPSSPATRPLDEAVETYIVGALGATTNPSGAHLLGCYQSTYQSPTVPTLASGTLHARLESMRDAANIYIAALPAWPDGDNFANPANSVFDALTKIVTNLGAGTTSSAQGLHRIGVAAHTFALASWQSHGSDSTLYAIASALNASTGTYDGATYIGAKVRGALTVGTVGSQLGELDTRVTSNASALAGKANLSGATFSGAVIHDGTLEANSTAQFDGAVTANAGITVASGQTLTLSGATAAGNFTLTGVPTFSAIPVFNGGLTILNSQLAEFSGPKMYTRTIDHQPLYDAAQWDVILDAESMLPVYRSLTISTGTTELVWVWRPPSGATVTAASVYLTPDTTPTHGGVPAVTIAVAKLARGALGKINDHSQTDTSGNVPAYETPHPLTVSGFTMTFTEGDLLLIRVTPETGVNAELGLRVEAPIISFTRTRLGEE